MLCVCLSLFLVQQKYIIWNKNKFSNVNYNCWLNQILYIKLSYIAFQCIYQYNKFTNLYKNIYVHLTINISCIYIYIYLYIIFILKIMSFSTMASFHKGQNLLFNKYSIIKTHQICNFHRIFVRRRYLRVFLK